MVAGLIRQLRPVGFDDLGIAAALEYCVDEWRSRLPGTTLDLTVDAGIGALEETRALTLFRLVQEALTNVARHSRASRVRIAIMPTRHADSRQIDITISDNGQGADLNAPRTGLGLVGMRERVTAFGGSLRLQSRPGGGFVIMLPLLPVAGAAAGSRRGGLRGGGVPALGCGE